MTASAAGCWVRAMSAILCSPPLEESEFAPWADLLAFDLAAGDAVVLRGDLGAGKTTFARAIIRALLGDDSAEVPSPTFPIAQGYAGPRLAVTHFDFYRLGGRAETGELGFEEALGTGAVLVEWAERVPELVPQDWLEIELLTAENATARRLAFTGHGRWDARLERFSATRRLLETAGWGSARLEHLQGDASTRRYARLRQNGRSVLLMDAPRQPDGPPVRGGKPYSRIAHLAEDVRPYVAVGRALAAAGISAPRIEAAELERGLVLVEDLGDRVFAREVASGAPQAEIWRAAVDALLAVQRAAIGSRLAVKDGTTHDLPRYDGPALAIEVELLLDWYWPALLGKPVPTTTRQEFLAAWTVVFDGLLRLPAGLVLRDYHSPNLIWLPERSGERRVGTIDFQDAVFGHRAYDLVSLLQDARIDVALELETELYETYIAAAKAEPGFDAGQFAFAYRALGAQRNTKILGIFARLAQRDGKRTYLQHLPRIWGYLERNLASGALEPIRAWYDRYLPADLRGRPLEGAGLPPATRDRHDVAT